MLVILFWGCTIEVRPLGYKPPVRKVAHKKHSTNHRRAASQDTMYVTPAWFTSITKWKPNTAATPSLMTQKIQHDGDKVKVPRTVLKHFHDLSRMSPPPKETE